MSAGPLTPGKRGQQRSLASRPTGTVGVMKVVGRSDEPALTLAEWFVRGGNAAYVTVAALTSSSILHHTHPLSSLVRTCS
jgi:hypothetical protein